MNPVPPKFLPRVLGKGLTAGSQPLLPPGQECEYRPLGLGPVKNDSPQRVWEILGRTPRALGPPPVHQGTLRTPLRSPTGNGVSRRARASPNHHSGSLGCNTVAKMLAQQAGSPGLEQLLKPVIPALRRWRQLNQKSSRSSLAKCLVRSQHRILQIHSQNTSNQPTAIVGLEWRAQAPDLNLKS